MSAKEIMEVLKFVIPLAWLSFEEYKLDIFLLFVCIILNVSTILHGLIVDQYEQISVLQGIKVKYKEASCHLISPAI